MELTEQQKQIFKKAIEKFGNKHQIIKAIEELSELQKELCKFLNSDVVNFDISEIGNEFADVIIMNYQLKKILDKLYPSFDEYLREMIDFKAKRLKKLINNS